MFPYSTINSELRTTAVDSSLFDFYRVVDIATHGVCEYGEGATQPVPNGETCHHIWNRHSPCANCTSYACIARQETIIKIEQLNGQILLIFSIPVKINGGDYALELIKDVTSSLVVPSAIKRDNIEIIQMVTLFNDLAAHDSFTKLYNKTYITNQLQVVLDESSFDENTPANQRPALIMFDLDRFKFVNDEYGHLAGDTVLLHMAERLLKLAEKFDDGWAGRFGGDEFVLCLPHGLGDAGEARIASAMAKMQAYEFEDSGRKFSVGASYGIACAEPGDTSDTLITRADKKLYHMKEQNHRLNEGQLL